MWIIQRLVVVKLAHAYELNTLAGIILRIISFILVQTILLVPVLPDGVLQLGSLEVVRDF